LALGKKGKQTKEKRNSFPRKRHKNIYEEEEVQETAGALVMIGTFNNKWN
jgi:hypothetical protein